MNVEQYYVIDTWPKYNNLNRIHTGGVLPYIDYTMQS